jgi:hypothetical protein
MMFVNDIGEEGKFTPILNVVRDFPKWLRTLEHEAAFLDINIQK